ncbi:MAG: hypothetical protein R3E90_02840 [Marinicella sp.]
MEHGKEKKQNKRYSVGMCLIFALFGYAGLIGFISELYQLLTGQTAMNMITIAMLGYVAYLFLYTAYKQEAPSWFDDVSILVSIRDSKSDDADN